MTDWPSLSSRPPLDDEFVDQLLDIRENRRLEIKRIVGDKLTRALETIVAFANSEGGYLLLGLEDPAPRCLVWVPLLGGRPPKPPGIYRFEAGRQGQTGWTRSRDHHLSRCSADLCEEIRPARKPLGLGEALRSDCPPLAHTKQRGGEDPEKGVGRDRVYGIEEKPENVGELQRLISAKVTPAINPPRFIPIGCTLRDGSQGSIIIVHVEKGVDVHSIMLAGTWIRVDNGNRQMTAEEVTRLRFERGKITAESQLADVPFELLDTDYWRAFATRRKLTRALPKALQHLGLAMNTAEGDLRPTHAAVLLFSENPGGLLRTKAAVRVFHYKGDRVQHTVSPNLQKPPISFAGPLLTQINEAYSYVLNELATGVQMGPLGFEIVQHYPARVIKEAITNAVIHRDYSLASDIQVRLFADRIEIESPGMLPGGVTATNIRDIGSFSRNPLIVSNLREFPDPPNLDAGEGVRMMFNTMGAAGLYPPVYLTRASTGRDTVMVQLLNESRPTVWNQVCGWLEEHGTIGNGEVRQIMKTEDVLTASKALKGWVDRGLLVVANPHEGKRNRRYRRPEVESLEPLFSKRIGKQRGQ